MNDTVCLIQGEVQTTLKMFARFIVDKDTDMVEDSKHSELCDDVPILADFPGKHRMDPVSHEYLVDCKHGTIGNAHAGVAIALWLKKHFDGIGVDIIAPVDLSLKHTKSNAINFIAGRSAVTVAIKNNTAAPRMIKASRTCENTMSSLEMKDATSQKSRCTLAYKDAGILMAPTSFHRERSEIRMPSFS